jgi:hypothetical protein
MENKVSVSVSQEYFERMAQKKSNHLEEDDIKALSTYLNDPVSSGLWRLNASWSKKKNISDVIWEEVSKEIKDEETITIKSGKRERKIKVDDKWRDEVKDRIFNNLTFMLSLFSYLAAEDNAEEELTSQYGATHELSQLILDLVETDVIKNSYKEAFEHFKNEIWFSGFNPTVRQKDVTKFQHGSAITLKGPRRSRSISIISWSGTPLKHLSKFLVLLNKIENIALMPIYSPEEEVFAPYFDLLEITYSNLVKQEHLKPLFKKSITQYRENNFSDCVSAIGLVAEDLLTQVYETFFRMQLNKGLTLGQLADEISVKVDSLYEKKVEIAPDFKSLYKQIQNSIDSSESHDVKALKQVRNLLTVTIDNNKYLNNKIENIGKVKQRKSVFTDRVLTAINELIRFRNASSHKSRIPIGPYEATRSIYSLIIFLMWWESEKVSIDWEMTPENIIRDCVTRNASV